MHIIICTACSINTGPHTHFGRLRSSDHIISTSPYARASGTISMYAHYRTCRCRIYIHRTHEPAALGCTLPVSSASSVYIFMNLPRPVPAGCTNTLILPKLIVTRLWARVAAMAHNCVHVGTLACSHAHTGYGFWLRLWLLAWFMGAGELWSRSPITTASSCSRGFELHT